MITLHRIKGKNFLSYKSLNFSFFDKTLCLIVGNNGSGKSSIPSAITWCLYGRTQKGLQTDQVINWDGYGDAWVRLECDNDGTDIVVVRSRGSNSELSLMVGDSVIEGTNTEKQRQIIKIFGADFETFVNTAFFSQGKVKFLGEITDTERKQLFKKVLNLERFDDAYKVADKSLKSAMEEQHKLEQLKLTREHDKDMLESELKHTITMRDTFEDNKKKQLTEYQERLDSIADEVGSRDESDGVNNMMRLSQLREELEDADYDDCNATIASYEKAKQQYREIEKSLSEEDRIIKSMEDSGTCPTCFQEIKNDKAIKEHMNIYASLNNKEFKAHEILEKLQKDAQEAEAKLKERQAKQVEYQTLQAKVEGARDWMNRLEYESSNIEKKMQALKSKTPDYDDKILEINEYINNNKSKLESIDIKLSKMANLIEILSATKEVFSKRGAVSFIMENYFGYLTDRANYYLGMLDSDMSLDIQATKETKKGDVREEISIEIQKDGRTTTYENLSDGERQRINIVLLFSLHRLCRDISNADFNFMFLDEVLDLSLDAETKETVVDLLRIIHDEGVRTICVISHAPEIRDQFEHVVQITKTDGISHAEMA